MSVDNHTLVYIAGPLNNGGLGSYEANLAEAIAMAERLRAKGYDVFCPHTAFAALRGYADEPDVLDLCLDVLCTLDKERSVLCVMPGWETSKGAIAERAVAQSYGIRLVTEDEL